MLTGGILSGVGSIFGGLFGSNASEEYIKQLQKAQQFLQDQEKQGLQNYQPFLNTGQAASNTLGQLMSTPGEGLLKGWDKTFTAPTAAEAAATPGYKFQLQQGLDAMQNSAAGKGNLLSGRALADLNNYAQGVASTNYQNVFNNAFTQYQSAYNTFLNNQNNAYNRLMGTAGMGLNAAGGMGNLMTNFGGDIASLMGQQGAAQAQGTMAMGQGISGALSNIGGMFTMKGLMGGGGGDGMSNLFSDAGLNVLQPSYMPGGGSWTGSAPSMIGPGMGPGPADMAQLSWLQ